VDWATPPTGAAEKFAINNRPIWEALEAVASRWSSGIEVRDRGKSIVLKPGISTVSSIDGPFRIVAREVTAKRDVATGIAHYDIALDLHWEPQFPVFRVGSTPVVTSARDDAGRALTAPAVNSFTPVPAETYLHSTVLRINGLDRGAKSMASMTGRWTITASPKMLSFVMADLKAALPLKKDQDGVSVTLTKAQLNGSRYDVELQLNYPDTHPEFESFESWTDWNRIRLVDPQRTRQHEPDATQITGNGRRVRVEHRFFSKAAVPVLADAAGWTLTYETPAPLMQYDLQFELKGILLP
jgi:hypothetical protein